MGGGGRSEATPRETGVASVAELRKAIWDRLDWVKKLLKDSPKDTQYKQIIDDLSWCLDKIGEFEAGVRADIREILPFTFCEDIFNGKSKDYTTCGTCPRLALCVKLRRVLGGGSARGER